MHRRDPNDNGCRWKWTGMTRQRSEIDGSERNSGTDYLTLMGEEDDDENYYLGRRRKKYRERGVRVQYGVDLD